MPGGHPETPPKKARQWNGTGARFARPIHTLHTEDRKFFCRQGHWRQDKNGKTRITGCTCNTDWALPTVWI